jgi:hypothetical protein
VKAAFSTADVFLLDTGRSADMHRVRGYAALSQMPVIVVIVGGEHAPTVRTSVITDILNLDHTFGSIKRDGQWEVPAKVVLRQRMGSASLDLSNAVFTSPHTNLEIDMVGGSIEIRVPADMQVVPGLRTMLASYEDHRREDNSTQTGHTLSISGRAVWGSVEVRGPKK